MGETTSTITSLWVTMDLHAMEGAILDHVGLLSPMPTEKSLLETIVMSAPSISIKHAMNAAEEEKIRPLIEVMG
jgi:hypothetical protein